MYFLFPEGSTFCTSKTYHFAEQLRTAKARGYIFEGLLKRGANALP